MKETGNYFNYMDKTNEDSQNLNNSDLIEPNHKLTPNNHANNCKIGLITTMFILLCMVPSFLDLAIAFTTNEYFKTCQRTIFPDISINLNIWYNVSGFFGIVYCLFYLILFCQLFLKSRVPYPTYYKEAENIWCDLSIAITKIISTLFMISWMITGLYLFIKDYSTVCANHNFIIYMWFRLLEGLMFYISILAYFNDVKFETPFTVRRVDYNF